MSKPDYDFLLSVLLKLSFKISVHGRDFEGMLSLLWVLVDMDKTFPLLLNI